MLEWIVWGFTLGMKVFGAAAGLILSLIAVGLFSLLMLAGLLELISGVSTWVSSILRRMSK